MHEWVKITPYLSIFYASERESQQLPHGQAQRMAVRQKRKSSENLVGYFFATLPQFLNQLFHIHELNYI